MADMMNRIKFPHIDTDNLVVHGDLTVQGTAITEHSADKIIEGAVTVINGSGIQSETTLLGQVILIGEDNSAYGILYDPQTEAVRLGNGSYNTESGTFQFLEGEGEPIAVRDLHSEDDGSLVMWDAEKYCLVKSPIKYDSGNDKITADCDLYIDTIANLNGNSLKLAIGADQVHVQLNSQQRINLNAGNTITLKGKELVVDSSLIINEGDASGNTSIAGGTTDKSFITELVGEAGNLLTLNPSEAKGVCSIALGADNKAIVGGSVAMGYKNTSGGTALRIDHIVDNHTLALVDADGMNKGQIDDWQQGDKILVVNDGEYILTFVREQYNGEAVFEEELPFNNLANITTLSKPNERTACNITHISYSKDYKIGHSAFAIGAENVSTGSGALAFGYKNKAAGDFGVAFGQENISGYSAFSAGIGNQALAKASTAFGDQTTASGINAFSAGEDTVASGRNSVALGNSTKANGIASVAEGFGTITEDVNTHAEGYRTQALKEGAHAEGKETIANAKFAHAEGEFTVASARAAHAEGAKFEALDNEDNVVATYTNEASGEGSHVEGCGTKVTAQGAHAEGVGAWDRKTLEFVYNRATGTGSHVEGRGTLATKQGAHAEGLKTQAIGEYTHAQGVDGIAEGRGSMVAGYGCVTTADAKYAIAAGDTLIATAEGQAVFGKYNTENDEALFIVGDGESDTNRHNAFEVTSRDGVVSLKVGEMEITENDISALLSILTNDLSEVSY